MIILHNTCQTLTNCTYDIRKFFSVCCEVLVWHEFHWVARTCNTAPYRWLFRDPSLSLRTLCSVIIKSTILLCSQRMSLSVSAEVSMNIVLPFFFVSPLLKHHLPILSSLFQKNVRGHAPPDPLESLWRAVTKQECLALDLPCSSSLLVHGSPWPAGHDLSASLPVVTWSNSVPSFGIIRLILWSRCRRQNAAGIWWQSWYNEKY